MTMVEHGAESLPALTFDDVAGELGALAARLSNSLVLARDTGGGRTAFTTNYPWRNIDCSVADLDEVDLLALATGQTPLAEINTQAMGGGLSFSHFWLKLVMAPPAAESDGATPHQFEAHTRFRCQINDRFGARTDVSRTPILDLPAFRAQLELFEAATRDTPPITLMEKALDLAGVLPEQGTPPLAIGELTVRAIAP